MIKYFHDLVSCTYREYQFLQKETEQGRYRY